MSCNPLAFICPTPINAEGNENKISKSRAKTIAYLHKRSLKAAAIMHQPVPAITVTRVNGSVPGNPVRQAGGSDVKLECEPSSSIAFRGDFRSATQVRRNG